MNLTWLDADSGDLVQGASLSEVAPSISHMVVNNSSCSHVPVHSYGAFLPTFPTAPSDLGLSVGTLPHNAPTPLPTTPDMSMDHWKAGESDGISQHISESGQWTDEYMDGWIFSKSGTELVHSDCCAAIVPLPPLPTCDPVNSIFEGSSRPLGEASRASFRIALHSMLAQSTPALSAAKAGAYLPTLMSHNIIIFRATILS
jgi:hypothetical protein